MTQSHPSTEHLNFCAWCCGVVPSPSPLPSPSGRGRIGASIQSLFGGNISIYTSLCERAREDAFNQMLAHAGQLGANAVLGVRYDATEVAAGITEVLCYGTAVYVEPAS